MKFLSRLIPVAFGIVAAAGAAVAAHAQNTAYPSFQHVTPQVSSAAAVALFWEPIGIVRSKNVSGVGHPGTGVYCVHASLHLNPDEIVPIATPEYSGSSVNTMFVYVVDSKTDCAGETSTVDIRTYTLSGGSAVLSDGISFYMSIL